MPALLLILLLLTPLQNPHATTLRRVAIVDRFFPPVEFFRSEREREVQLWLHGLLDADNDRRKEPYYHGDLVRLIASHPDIAFIQYPISGDGHPLESILKNLREIRARQRYQRVDAVLLAWESSTLISAFGEPLQPGRRAHYKARLREWAEQGGDWDSTLGIIAELEALVGTGVSVVTIAGNGGRRMVNTFSFAEGVVTVGAIEEELGDFISNNALVDRHEKASYIAHRVDDAGGRPVGYDIDGDGCVDVPLQRLSGYGAVASAYPLKSWPPLKGSSFAAPAALKKILLREEATRSCSVTAVPAGN